MKRSVLRFALAVVTAIVVMSLGGSTPHDENFSFTMSTVWAEDCPPEHLNCDDGGPSSPVPPGGGGGGGGGQRPVEVCAIEGHECEGIGCGGNDDLGAVLEIWYCRRGGVISRVYSRYNGECCWQ